jgi:lysophospholipase L1-like esterase
VRKLLGILGIFILTACANPNSPPLGSSPAKVRYVAMGSSYAAGPKLGNPKPNTPKRCGRDFGNYATIVAQRLEFELIDVTCSGATTAHILEPWNELPAQLDAVTPDTGLVTITIGGNDVDFALNLYISACDASKIERPCPTVRSPGEAAWLTLEGNMTAIAQRVRLQAPKAKLIIVDYITIVPASACDAAPLSAENIDLMRGVASRLAELTGKVARQSGAELVSAGALSQSHTPCDAEAWSTGITDNMEAAPWHPNGAGMQAIADALIVELQKHM